MRFRVYVRMYVCIMCVHVCMCVCSYTMQLRIKCFDDVLPMQNVLLLLSDYQLLAHMKQCVLCMYIYIYIYI
jgi:hypothetical protein